MSNENNNKALDLINELNRLNLDLAYAINQNCQYEYSDSTYWEDEEVRLRKKIEALELELNLLN